ncbi:Polygalacturonase [Handroanthus impetiginosus]|uniref:Polygalacturonase n=1 Tax=Handroanthus impetiginosus TaxID=429701 RepID=A0A2G9I315_9LAMI|nr:Polygalacturonase [Handroanthus impetiginosus]
MANQRESRVIINACFVIGIACFLTMNGVECNPVGARRSLADETVFDVMQYDAKADGKTDDATAFIQAWRAACESNGTAKVLIPSGKNFMAGEVVFAGPCTAQAPITIEIQGNISASSDPSAYSDGAWIMFEKVENIVITGGGTINGQGSNVWQYSSGDTPLAVSLVLEEVGNGEMHGLNFVDSMGFHIKVTDSRNISLWNLAITAPGKSPNTDGIHLSNSTNVNITDSVIGTGDDCVSIGHGNNNILVSGITCGPGHGISIGSLGKREEETSVKGVTVINCTLTGTTNGARIKTYHESPQINATSIVFQDIVMNQVQHPIIIDQHYDSKKRPQQSSVKISDARFINIKGTTVSPIPVILNCSSTFPCEGIELEQIDLVPFGTIGPLKSECSNAQIILKGNLNPPAPTACI